MTTEKITISEYVRVPIEKAWEYYTDPYHIRNWNFANDDWHCPEVRNELKKGGKYAAKMEAKDGSFGFTLEAVYDLVAIWKEIKYYHDRRESCRNKI